MPEMQIPVVDKFSGYRPHQIKYSYCATRTENSENLMTERYIWREGAELLGGNELGGVTVTNEAEVTLPLAAFARGDSGAIQLDYTYEGNGATVALVLLDGEQSYEATLQTHADTRKMTFTLDRMPEGMTPSAVRLELRGEGSLKPLSVRFASALDTLGRRSGQPAFYEVTGGELTEKPGCGEMTLSLCGEATLRTPVFPNSNATVYNMKMPQRNTVFMVLRNDSDAKEATFTYITWEHEEPCSLKVPIKPRSGFTAYYVNLSATEGCVGRMKQFALTVRGEGSLTLKRYSFEEEKKLVPECGTVTECVAENGFVRVAGSLRNARDFRPVKLSLYATSMAIDNDSPDGKKLLAQVEATAGDFVIGQVPFQNGAVTLLSSQLLLLAEDKKGRTRRVCERFYIDNYWDYQTNPYAFDLPDHVFFAEDFGAKGDAISNDTDAIQAAIDAAAKEGGYAVVSGDDSFYGKRYLVTNLLLRGGVNLVIEKGAILWQDQIPEDYCYRTSYGHDGVIPGINWTHSMHISNLPLVAAHNCENIKITGGGALRMLDTGSEEGIGMPGYSTGCPDRIHQIPLGIMNADNIEMTDIDILRSNNYHIALYNCSKVSMNNVKLHEVKCVSGDGFGLGFGTNHVLINRCFLQSNDDGVTLWSCWHDPRGILWWANKPEGDHGIRFVDVVHSYLNSGGGKCIAIIPWGTSAPDLSLVETSDIEVHDNTLAGVNPVGTWPDNPYHGKQPFDNTEEDDYSPVKDFRITGNVYDGNCTLGPIHATDFLSDCGLHSHGNFVNGDFTLGGLANWNTLGTVYLESAQEDGKEKSRVHIENGMLYEGLYLPAGHHIFTVWVDAPFDTVLFARRTDNGAKLAELAVDGEPGVYTLSFDTAEDMDCHLGVNTEKSATVDHFALETVFDADARNEKMLRNFKTDIGKGFTAGEGALFCLAKEKPCVEVDGPEEAELLHTKKTCTSFGFESTFRVLMWYEGARGYRFRFGKDGQYVLTFRADERTLVLTEQGRECYRRENFFFTSDDYHTFGLQAAGNTLTVMVDAGKLDSIALPVPLTEGAVSLECFHSYIRAIHAKMDD